ncbi:MAG: hypothetical protein A2096_14985 [Spirochaetes bacterium GWF1_41_5]|nr:MAG: hypothetical protein A2096_14985 [Spirochaetes bacterium GWF1_41_5]
MSINQLLLSDNNSSRLFTEARASLLVNENDPEKRHDLLDELRSTMRSCMNRKNYERPDLSWYHNCCLEYFLFYYESSLFNRKTRKYRIKEMMKDGRAQFGGYDLVILWQPFPRSGIDGRNQFDFYREMPDGLAGQKEIVEEIHACGAKAMLNYIPWGGAEYNEGRTHAEIMAELVKKTGADGIYGDTMNGFDDDFCRALAAVRPGLVFNTEGSPTLKSAETLTGCWGQNFLPIPPQIPLVRFIEPRHSVRLVDRDSLTREFIIKLGLFWGMGHVVWENIFGWYNPYNETERKLCRNSMRLLRKAKEYFTDQNWQPLAATLQPGVFANRFGNGKHTCYTVINCNQFPVQGEKILHDENIGKLHEAFCGKKVKQIKNTVCFDLEPFSVYLLSDDPQITAPVRENKKLYDFFDRSRPGNEWNIPLPVHQTKSENTSDMIKIPAGVFKFTPLHLNNFSAHNQGSCYDFRSRSVAGRIVHLSKTIIQNTYFMDKTEVTNRQYHEFLQSADYCPADLTNFLKHWNRPDLKNPRHWDFPKEKENHPAVYVDLDDARAYAAWRGKRLPTEEEWHYAAQGEDGRIWPWGNEFLPEHANGRLDSRIENWEKYGVRDFRGNDSTNTVPVDAFPAGASPFGCLDMCGNVWEWTESERDDGHTRYSILKGGSFMVMEGSKWYTACGPQPCAAHEKMLLLYPGLDRCSTVGFRCAADL